MAQSVLHNVRYRGLTTCVPERAFSNVQDCPPEQRSERERLVRNIGIETRRVCLEGVVFSDLALVAAEKLIAGLGWEKSSIDALIVVTQSPDYPIPATAIILQDKLGLPHSTIAFDINLGCSGYAYGLFTLGSMLSAHGLKRGIMLVGDKSSNPLSLDNGLLSLFGDAATATALEFDETAQPMYFNMGSDGSGHKAIIIEAGGQRVPIQPHHLERLPGADGISRKGTDVILDGPSILNFSIREVPVSVAQLVEFSPFSLEDIDYFVFHQANRMINETIRKKLGLPAEKVPMSLKDFGNTSSASIPVTINTRLQEALAQGPQRLLLSGFGVGLSWASCILNIENAYLPPLIEI
ncbi:MULTISPECIES: ketoacyl-ACP synthase III [Methylovorus]|jgi:3-oxoacyl-[acyl-carrier-protein] synthase III|uniref:ketoacyl-ACP synthase III n=1 Tax=Methylovorus TaxID=81682 RepID=UPI00059E3167|nr:MULTISPECIES: ketoacyl-ACP synthase III [Methylovorus]KAF0842702.1 3-oxoacyl-[acyl-carrier-protein] synthase-3 [Methylovorus glucosotrophus]